MKLESVKQRQKFLNARDLLHSAVEQYETTLGAFTGALDYADAAMAEYSDPEAVRQIAAMKKLIANLPRAAFETFGAIAETMEALANEVTANEKHVPAGVS